MCVTFVTCECVCVALVAIAGRRYAYTVCTYLLLTSVSNVSCAQAENFARDSAPFRETSKVQQRRAGREAAPPERSAALAARVPARSETKLTRGG